MKISKDDPILSTYLYGEPSPEEIRQVETAMQQDPELAAYVASLRTVGDSLQTALKNEKTVSERKKNEPALRAVFPVWARVIAWSTPAVAACLVLILFNDVDTVMETKNFDVPRPIVANETKENDQIVESLPVPPPKAEEQPAFTTFENQPSQADAEGIAKKEMHEVSLEKIALKTSDATLPKIEGKNISSLEVPAVPVEVKTPQVSVQMNTKTDRGLDSGFSAVASSGVHIGMFISEEKTFGIAPLENRESYPHLQESGYKNPLVSPLSTFSIDVDTSSYSNFRRFINAGQLPVQDSIRIEEWLNYFDYDYPTPPALAPAPFATDIEMTDAPWSEKVKLARIGIQGYELPWEERPATNLVFLIDVSGSMRDPNKLPLLKESLSLLVNRLDERDRVAIVVYAGSSGLALPSTTANNRETILHALTQLQAGGSTNGQAGIEQAYAEAEKHFITGGNNRVILCTDGDFNVGMTGESELEKLISQKAKKNIFLSILGFGMGNYQDKRLEILSNRGDGNYFYIDSAKEARKVFLRDLTGTMITIAKDVKLQVEFNPQKVQSYRLIGYENRALAAEDFNDDQKDAGEIGAGHRVTALYEIVPSAETTESSTVDALKYQETSVKSNNAEWFTVKIRFKRPAEETSQLLEMPFAGEVKGFAQSSLDTQFASAVAGAAITLRGSEYTNNFSLRDALRIASRAIGEDPGGYRSEFIELISRAKALSEKNPPAKNTEPLLDE